MKNLLNKKILFIICGGISAYKSLETIRLFKKSGAEIKTILTASAKEFVTPLSITALSQGKVYSELFSVENETEMDHISLSRWADVVVIAPATANTISKLAQGTTDDLASTVVLASDKIIYLAPAMNVRMWEHQTTKANLKKAHKDLDKLTKKVKSELNKDFKSIVFHDAYQYFEKRFDVNVLGAFTVNTDVLPGAEQLSEIREVIEHEKVSCVFSEPQFNPDIIKAVAKDTNIKTGVIDPLGATLNPGKTLYFDLIRNMSKSFKGC